MTSASRARSEVTLSEVDGVRYLHFGSEWVQGAMNLAHPYRLELDYVQRMMSWLLFAEPPARIAQLGLGAASLTKFCHRRLRASHIDAVEIDAAVITAAHRWFHLPMPDDRLRLWHRDAFDHLRDPLMRAAYGVIQVDLYDREARAPVLDTTAFYRALRVALAPGGIAVVNLFGDELSFPRSWQRLNSAFDGRVLAMAPVPAGNVVVLAFRDAVAAIERAALSARGEAIERRLRIPAGQWVDALRPVRREGLPGGGRWRLLTL